MDPKIKTDKLREKAEKIFKSQINSNKDLSKNDEIVHELRVHQIELEIQNQELREAQINLEDSRRKYFDLYNFAPVGYFTLDIDGIISEANLAGAAMLGVDKIKLFNTLFILYIDPEHRNEFHHHLIDTKKSRDKNTLEVKLQKNDKNTFYAHLEIKNVLDEEGNFKEFILTVTDINSLKMAETKLSEVLESAVEAKNNLEKTVGELYSSREEYRIMGETIPYGVWKADADGKLLYTSQSFLKLLDKTMDDIKGLKWANLINNENIEPVRDKWLHSVKTGEEWDDEIKVIGPDGKYHTVLTRGLPVLDSNGVIISWVGINLDIDDRKETELELLKMRENLGILVQERTSELEDAVNELKFSNQELQQFVNLSSHDLQEPLRLIASFAQLLERRYKGRLDKDADEFIYYIVDAVKRMQTLINDLLEYSKVGKGECKFELTDLNELIDDILFNIKDTIRAKNIEVTYDSLPQVVADKKELILLFQNIIGNAVKFRKEDKPLKMHIAVKMEEHNHEYLFSVSDNGIGMDPQYAEQIFDIFQRLNSMKEYSGTGIGLSICKKIVDQHSGHIWVESELGKGSTFYFTLPMIK